MCHILGYLEVPPVGLEPVALPSGAKHSTNKSLRSLTNLILRIYFAPLVMFYSFSFSQF